jgi:hypothetical protein
MISRTRQACPRSRTAGRTREPKVSSSFFLLPTHPTFIRHLSLRAGTVASPRVLRYVRCVHASIHASARSLAPCKSIEPSSPSLSACPIVCVQASALPPSPRASCSSQASPRSVWVCCTGSHTCRSFWTHTSRPITRSVCRPSPPPSTTDGIRRADHAHICLVSWSVLAHTRPAAGVYQLV